MNNEFKTIDFENETHVYEVLFRGTWVPVEPISIMKGDTFRIRQGDKSVSAVVSTFEAQDNSFIDQANQIVIKAIGNVTLISEQK